MIERAHIELGLDPSSARVPQLRPLFGLGDQGGELLEQSVGVPFRDEVRAIAREGADRFKCNDLTGCPMLNTLLALGREAAPAVADAYATSTGDGFWRLQLIDVVGRMGNPDSVEFLVHVLTSDKHIPARTQAALALARLRPLERKEELAGAALAMTSPTMQPVVLALGYALAVMGDPRGRPLIEEHLVVPEGQTYRWDKLRPGVYAAGQLRMVHLRGRIEEISRRADPFVRREAVGALSAMRDRAAVPALIERLGDEIPGVRDAAQLALVTLTGFRHKTTADQWRRWWATEQPPR